MHGTSLRSEFTASDPCLTRLPKCRMYSSELRVIRINGNGGANHLLVTCMLANGIY